MVTTIIALAIFGAAMVLIAVFAVAYCYKLLEKYNKLLYEYNNLEHDHDISNDIINGNNAKIEYLEQELAKKGEEIAHLKECISEYKKEILQYKNQIDELQKDNTLLGQQLAEYQVPSEPDVEIEDKPVFNVGDEVELIEDYETAVLGLIVKGSLGVVVGTIFNDTLEVGVHFGEDWTYFPTKVLKHAEPSKPISEPVTTDPKELYIAKQKQWVKENNVRNGTPVILVSDFEDYQDGFDARYSTYIDNYIGKKGRVIMVEDGSISVQFKDDYWFIPYFCLEINRRKR